jgi:hypothetical protein
MDLDMKKNLLRPQFFNYETESISKILDEFLFCYIKNFERFLLFIRLDIFTSYRIYSILS